MEVNWVTTRYILDSNVVIAINYLRDSLHQPAIELLKDFESKPKFLNIFLISEISTVLLQKTKKKKEISELTQHLVSGKTNNMQVSRFSNRFFKETIEIFSKQKSHKLSFADCSIIAQARIENIKTILSFDRDLRAEFKKEFEFLPKRIPRV